MATGVSSAYWCIHSLSSMCVLLAQEVRLSSRSNPLAVARGYTQVSAQFITAALPRDFKARSDEEERAHRQRLGTRHMLTEPLRREGGCAPISPFDKQVASRGTDVARNHC